MRNTMTFAGALMMLAGSCGAKDAFDAIHCGDDIAKALIGRPAPNGRVAAIEKQHSDLNLADEGADEISDSLSYIGWNICGHSFHLLESGGTIRDALLADHSRARPGFLGTCEIANRPTPFVVFGILDGAIVAAHSGHAAPNDQTLLPAISAWRIDATRQAFVKLETENLKCPADGIFTLDGGP